MRASAMTTATGEATLAPVVAVRSDARRTFDDYLTLTKPKVQLLLILTLVCTMLIAGTPSIWLIVVTCVGGYMSAGAAGVFNHWYDRDIDAAMTRTADRPIPAGRISERAALTFCAVLLVGAMAILGLVVNPLTAAMSFCGFIGYTGVYTVWLKRRTPQNIVIGGAAGAFPPLVGWAAVTGGLGGEAFYLFAIVFFWTPAHFWALAIMMKDEYAAVGVPMLPVVRGERETRRQVLLYTVLLYAVSQLIFCAQGLGAIYLVCSMVLGLAYIAGSVLMQRRTDRAFTVRMYLFSMLYLALLFASMVADVKL